MIDKIITLGQLSDFQQDSVYHTRGVCPTLKARDYKDAVKIMEEPKVNVIGQMDNSKDHTHESANRVYDTAGCETGRTTCGGGGLEPKIIDDTYENREPRAYEDVAPSIRAEREGFKVCAMRGRNPEKPTSRQPGLPLEQMIEVAENGEISNTITSVYKDNMLLENTSEEPIKVRQATESRYRIRKLTERECWRLMGFTDEEFDKAASVNSRSQLYKQAGNSIVVDVLVALFTEVVGSIGTVNTHSGEQINLFDLLD